MAGLSDQVPKLAARGKLSQGRKKAKEAVDWGECITVGWQLCHEQEQQNTLSEPLRRTILANYAASSNLVPKKIRQAPEFTNWLKAIAPSEAPAAATA